VKKVFVNGCFDILHPGHVELLKYASSLGDTLMVAIDSDERVSQLKGPSRPINNSSTRATMLSAIRYVDTVVFFNSELELESIVKKYSPHVMVVGSDYKDKKVVGSQYANQLVFFDKIYGFSTTKTIKNINNR